MNAPNSPYSSKPAVENGGVGSAQSGGPLTETKNALAQTARETASKVKSATSNAAARAKEEVEKVATDKKREAADRFQHYSSAIHDSAKSMEEKDPNIAWVSHRAADKLQGMADYMRNKNFSELRHDAEDWARRHPALFFGGMFLAGLIVGNVVKASRRNISSESDNDSADNRSDGSSTEPYRSGQATVRELAPAEGATAGI